MNKKIGNIFKGDKVIWMVFFFLCMISIIEVYSASSSLSYKSGNYMAPVIRHVGILMAGVFGMICMLKVKCKYFKLVTPIVMLAAFLMLLYVLIAGHATNDANRWITLLGIQFQPSEIAKGAVVLAVAQILSAMQTEKGADPRAFQYIVCVTGFYALFIVTENLSTALLMCATVLCMMIVGRVPMRQIGKLIGVVSLAGVILVAIVMVVGKDKNAENPNNTYVENSEKASSKENSSAFAGLLHRADTWKSRIDKFIDHKDIKPEDFDMDKDGQVGHANIAIVSSNIVGKGPGNSVERDFLSQAFSDFIYAIIIEEMGIEGAAFVAMLYIILLFRAGRIASRCENNFPAFLCMGLAILLVVQALFNMMVAVGLAPVTGQPLPLISRGGTSSIINCLYIGMILSISRTAKKKDQSNKDNNVTKLATA